MENWGLVFFDDVSLLLDPVSGGDVNMLSNLPQALNETVGDGLEHRYHVMDVVAHEVAHQWFGNLVTLQW